MAKKKKKFDLSFLEKDVEDAPVATKGRKDEFVQAIEGAQDGELELAPIGTVTERLQPGESAILRGGRKVTAPESPFVEPTDAQMMEKFRRSREGRAPQSIQEMEEAFLGPVDLSPAQKNGSFGVLQSDGQLGEFSPEKIIQSRTRVPLAPGQDPALIKERPTPSGATGFGVLKDSGQLGEFSPDAIINARQQQIPFAPGIEPEFQGSRGVPAQSPEAASEPVSPRTPEQAATSFAPAIQEDQPFSLSELDNEPAFRQEEPLRDFRSEAEIDEGIAQTAAKIKTDQVTAKQLQLKAENGDASAEELIAMAITGILPAIIGGLVGGEFGAAEGAALGAEALSKRNSDTLAREKENRAAERDLASKKANNIQDLEKFMLQQNALKERARERDNAQMQRARELEQGRNLRAGQSIAARQQAEQSRKGFISDQKQRDRDVNMARINAKKIQDDIKNEDDLTDRFNKTETVKTANEAVNSYNGLATTIKKVGISRYLSGEGVDDATVNSLSPEQRGNLSDKGTMDVALLYNFIRGIDPGSVVREGEVALINRSRPWLNQLVSQFNKNIKQRGFLLPEERRAMLTVVQDNLEGFTAGREQVAKQFRSIGKRRGMDFDKLDISVRPITKDIFSLEKEGGESGPQASEGVKSAMDRIKAIQAKGGK